MSPQIFRSGGTPDRTRPTKLNLIRLFVRHSFWTTTPAFDKRFKAPCGTDVTDVGTVCKEGQLKEALHVLDDLDYRGIKANSDTYVSLLRKCIPMKSLTEGKQVHAHIVKSGVKPDILLGSTLANLYVKCGSMVDAREVFDQMRERNVFTWTIMIAGYTQQGQAEEALELFQQMEQKGVNPDKVTFASILKACASITGLEQGKQIHAHIIKCGFESDVFVGSTLVDMYAKCGNIERARQVFNTMPKRNVVSWTAMIAGYVQHGLGEEALKLFWQMKQEGVKPNEVTFVSILKACTGIAALEQGKQIHTHITDSGFELDVYVVNTLVDMYAKCGSVVHARQVFDKMSKRTVVSWTAMIAGYVQHGQGEKALELFRQMEQKGVKPNKVTFVNILKACTCTSSLEQGKQIHANIIKNGFESDISVGNTLIGMYAKCGSLVHARLLFNDMPERDVVSWNAMIAGYVQHEQGDEALHLFGQMEQVGVKPNEVTFTSILKACAGPAALNQGKHIHARIIESGFHSDVSVRNTLVGMYAKCGSMKHARQIFEETPKRDVVSWNAMIAGCTQHGQSEEALAHFWQMERVGVQPNELTFVSILKACAGVAALEQAERIHANILRNGFESHVSVGNSLVDMYAKCGCIRQARQVFNKMPKRDVVSWNAMLAGYAQHGHGKEALQLVQQMHQEGMKLDHITIVCVLSACSHAGLLDDGRSFFNSMSRDHGIMPINEHYACMVDLLGRAGKLEEAEDFIKKMPLQPSVAVWTTLLGACRIYGHKELAIRAAKAILQLEPQSTAACVLLSNIYAAGGLWKDKAKVRKLMNKCVERKPGCCNIEVNNRVHTFVVEDTAHPQLKEIHTELKKLLGQMDEAGYVPDTRFALHDVEDDHKEFSLCYHSEKLAIVFGIITSFPGTSICIVKNIRVCCDCHSATKLISKIVGREIVVRDANRLHHFMDGVCSCGDYW